MHRDKQLRRASEKIWEFYSNSAKHVFVDLICYLTDGYICCWQSCNHLLVYEPGYYVKTYEYITAKFMPMHYKSSIRELRVRYCQSQDDDVPRNFSFTYNVLGKLFNIFEISFV